MNRLTMEERYLDAERIARKAIENALDVWGKRPVTILMHEGTAAIRPCDYEGYVTTANGIRLLTKHGPIDTMETVERIHKLFTPPRWRPLLHPVLGWNGTYDDGVVGWTPDAWEDNL